MFFMEVLADDGWLSSALTAYFGAHKTLDGSKKPIRGNARNIMDVVNKPNTNLGGLVKGVYAGDECISFGVWKRGKADLYSTL